MKRLFCYPKFTGGMRHGEKKHPFIQSNQRFRSRFGQPEKSRLAAAAKSEKLRQKHPSHIHLTRNFTITHSSHAKRPYHTSITRRKTFITHPRDKVSRQKQLLCRWKPYCGGIFMKRNSLERATAFALRISRRSFFVSAGLCRCRSPPPFILFEITYPKTK